MKLLLVLISSFSILISCSSSTSNVASNQNNPRVDTSTVKLPKEKIKLLNQTVFEVVVPKKEDDFMVYETSLPYNRLSYQEQNDKYRGIGTAFIIQPGRFISAAHLFDVHFASTYEDYFVRDSQGKVYKINMFHKYSQYRDIVEFDAVGFKGTAVLPVNKEVEVGDDVLSVGNAFGQGVSIRGGQMASTTPEAINGAWNDIRFSAPASPGNSGGPLLNSNGEVIGVIAKKTESENLNYATPIAEVFKLSNSKSEFYRKNLSKKDRKFEIVRDWKFSSPLPADFKTLKKAAETSHRTFLIALARDFQNKFKNELFPLHKNFKKILSNQGYGTKLNYMAMDQTENWKQYEIQTKTYDISKDQHLSVGRLGESTEYIFYLMKPKNMKLKDFVENHKLINDTFVKGNGWARSFAGENIGILSYGKPHETEYYRDNFGRPWTINKWRTHFDDSLVMSACAAVPDGVNCKWMYLPVHYETAGIDNILKDSLNETVFSYDSDLSGWKEFYSLNPKYLPKVLENSHFDYQTKKFLKAHFQHYDLNLEQADIASDSNLSVYVGYNPEKVTELEVHGVIFKARSDKKNNFQSAFAILKPDSESSNDQKKRWQDLMKGNSPYNGTLYSADQSKYIRFVSAENNRTISSKSKENHKKLYLLSCGSESSTANTELEKACQKFRKGIQIK